MTGSPIRQDYLERAISWKSGGLIGLYMSAHQHDPNANELWSYFQAVISWVQLTFPQWRKEMKGLDWGSLYDQFRDVMYNTADLEKEISGLMVDEDVTRKKGIYAYVLTREDKHLSIRAFPDSMKRAAYERMGGFCGKCGKPFELAEMEADHITPWIEGGRTNAANCQMLCKKHNRSKGAS